MCGWLIYEGEVLSQKKSMGCCRLDFRIDFRIALYLALVIAVWKILIVLQARPRDCRLRARAEFESVRSRMVIGNKGIWIQGSEFPSLRSNEVFPSLHGRAGAIA